MQNTLNRINKIQDEWNKPIELNFREPTQYELDQIKSAQAESKKQAQKKAQIQALKAELDELNKDFMRSAIGFAVPNLSDKKHRFVDLYNKLCLLEGKEPNQINI